MKMCQVGIYNRSGYPLPEYQSEGAAGMDLRAALSEPLVLEPRKVYMVPTGLFLEIPVGYEGQVRARSGLALKHGITLVNGVGTIDSDYRGEVGVILMNLLDDPFTIQPGDRIAQLVFAEIAQASFAEVKDVEALSVTQRGEGGFGHSGK